MTTSGRERCCSTNVVASMEPRQIMSFHLKEKSEQTPHNVINEDTLSDIVSFNQYIKVGHRVPTPRTRESALKECHLMKVVLCCHLPPPADPLPHNGKKWSWRNLGTQLEPCSYYTCCGATPRATRKVEHGY
jgi:hypothetical protein